MKQIEQRSRNNCFATMPSGESALFYKNRNGNVMKPVQCIEAVASKNPGDYRLVAIQWHPEGYCKEEDSVHKQLLNFVVNALVPEPAPVSQNDSSCGIYDISFHALDNYPCHAGVHSSDTCLFSHVVCLIFPLNLQALV